MYTKRILSFIRPLSLSLILLPLISMKLSESDKPVRHSAHLVNKPTKSANRFLGYLSYNGGNMCITQSPLSNTNLNTPSERQKLNSWKEEIHNTIKDKVGKDLFTNLITYGKWIGLDFNSYYQHAVDNTLKDNQYGRDGTDACKKQMFKDKYADVIVQNVSVNKFVNKIFNKYSDQFAAMFDKAKNGSSNTSNTNGKNSVEDLKSKLKSKNGYVDVKGIIDILRDPKNAGNNGLFEKIKKELESASKQWILDAIKHEAILEGVNVGAIGVSAISLVVFLLFTIFKRNAATGWVIFNVTGSLISATVLGYFLFNFFYNPYALILPVL